MKRIGLALGVCVLAVAGAAAAQNAPPAAAPPAAARQGPQTATLGSGPWDFATQEVNLHVAVVARGLDHP